MISRRTSLFLLALAGCSVPPPFAQEDLRPGGSMVATPEGTGVLLRRTDSDAPVRTLSGGHDAPVLAVHFNDAGDRLVSGDERGKIVFWDPETGSILGSLPGHRGAVRQFATRARVPDLASASDDGTVKLWDLGAAAEARTLAGHAGPVYGLAFSPDGRILASGSADRTVKLWDVDGGAERRTLRGPAAAVRTVDFDGAGDELAAGGDDGSVTVWNLKGDGEPRTLERARGAVGNLFLSRDGRWALAYRSFRDPSSGERSAALSIWNVATGELVVPDYLFEARIAPADWPYRAVFREIADKAARRPR